MLASQEFWATDELTLQTFALLPPPDLRNCAQVSLSLNRTAVQSLLDQHKIWNPKRSVLQLARDPKDIDGLSALLLSVHVKSLDHVTFSLEKVNSFQSAVQSFRKMQRLVDRMVSLDAIHLCWPSGALQDQPISDLTLTGTCKCVEDFLNTIISKGCTALQLDGFDVFESEYALKSNTVERTSVWETAKRYFPFRVASIGSKSSQLSDEAPYCRISSGFSAPWVSVIPSPTLSQETKITTFRAHSISLFRPPFSQWTFALLKASPVSSITLSFKDAPDNRAEWKLLLNRLAGAIPSVSTIHLIDGADAGLTKDIVVWLGRFPGLKYLAIGPKYFYSGNDIEDMELQALARLPLIKRVTSTPPFLCAYLASCRKVNKGTLPESLKEVTIFRVWRSSTESAVSAFTKDVERLHKAIADASQHPKALGYPRVKLHIMLHFDYFHDSAEVLSHLWSRMDFKPGTYPSSQGQEKASLEALPYFHSAVEYQDTLPRLSLKLNLPSTANNIQRGVIDEEIMAFCRMFPPLREIQLCSSNPANTSCKSQPLRKEQLDKFKSVCPKLKYGKVYY
ncbi:hypothetical protein MD484_g6851, partial [Candolleomyces efflorescens]